MYRIPEKVEKMKIGDRVNYFFDIAKSFPEEKKKFTGEELMISRDFGAYELFRSYAHLEKVGYFFLADFVFGHRFKGKWARIKTADMGTRIAHVDYVHSPYRDEFEDDYDNDGYGKFFGNLDEEYEWWGALIVSSPFGDQYDIPFCYVVEAEYFTDDDEMELKTLIEKEKRVLKMLGLTTHTE